MPKRDKKDPAKPKGRMSAYACFVKECRAEKKAQGIDVNFTEFSKECSQKWNEDSKVDKDRYFKMAEKDRKRYEEEMATYTPPPGSGRGKKGKRVKDPDQPKRAK